MSREIPRGMATERTDPRKSLIRGWFGESVRRGDAVRLQSNGTRATVVGPDSLQGSKVRLSVGDGCGSEWRHDRADLDPAWVLGVTDRVVTELRVRSLEEGGIVDKTVQRWGTVTERRPDGTYAVQLDTEPRSVTLVARAAELRRYPSLVPRKTVSTIEPHDGSSTEGWSPGDLAAMAVDIRPPLGPAPRVGTVGRVDSVEPLRLWVEFKGYGLVCLWASDVDRVVGDTCACPEPPPSLRGAVTP